MSTSDLPCSNTTQTAADLCDGVGSCVAGTCVCPPPFTGKSAWGIANDCHISTEFETVAYAVTGTACGALTLLWSIYAQATITFHRNCDKIQRRSVRLFLFHTAIESALQTVLGCIFAVGIKAPDQPTVVICITIIGTWGAIAGLPHACGMWVFILPNRLIQKKTYLLRIIGALKANMVRLDIVSFISFLACSIVPVLVHQNESSVKLCIQLAYAAISSVIIIMPVFFVPLCSVMVYNIMADKIDRGVLPGLVALFATGRSAVGESSQKAIIFKLQASTIIVLTLGVGALAFCFIVPFVPWMYARPHIFFSGLMLIATLWQSFIMFVFCRNLSSTYIKRRRASVSNSPLSTTLSSARKSSTDGEQ